MKKKKHNYVRQVIILTFILILLLASSYAWLTLRISGTKTNILRAGKLSLILDDTTESGILLEKAVPVSDSKGLTTTAYTFKLKNEGSTAASYKIYLDDLDLESTETRMNDSYINYHLTKNGEALTTSAKSIVQILFKEGDYLISYDPEEKQYTSVRNAPEALITQLNQEISSTTGTKEEAVNLVKSKLIPTGTYEVSDKLEKGDNDLTRTGTNPNRVLDSGTISGNTTNTYTLRVWIDQDTQNEVMGTTFYAKLRVKAEQSKLNGNIKEVYAYNQTAGASNYCVIGEEETCQKLGASSNTYNVGTIIKYAVNNNEEKYFYVLHDDGDTLTMQQRENTVYNVPWYTDNSSAVFNNSTSTADITKGPLTALQALEEATSNWTNVNMQTYKMGTTAFGQDNAYTGCSDYSTCNVNPYAFSENRTAKARMITVQEATAAGCRMPSDSTGRTPIWLFNYLSMSTDNGGTVNDTTTVSTGNFQYWTMNAQVDAPWAWYLRGDGYMFTGHPKGDDHTGATIGGEYQVIHSSSAGARAVVVINK